MAEIPKSQQDYFNKLKEALSTGDNELLSNLVRTKNPLAIRHDLSTALGQHVRENYDEPLNIFHNKEILKDIPVNYTKLPPGIAGRYSKEENQLYLPHEDIEVPNRQMGSRLHEYAHADDVLNGFEDSEPFNKTKATLNRAGLEAAEDTLGKHHASGFFEKDALSNLLNNKKLGVNMADNSEKIKLLNQLRQKGQITDEMFNDNVNKLMYKQNLRPDAMPRSATSSDVIGDIADKGGVRNLNSKISTTPESMAGIKANVEPNRFANIKNALSDSASTAGKMAEEEGGVLRSLRGETGSTTMLPMLGLGAAALGGMGVAKKLGNGDYGNAALDATDIGTDFIPGVGLAKMALRPTELGNSELPPEIMQQRTAYNNSISNPDLEDNTKEASNDKQERFKNILAKLQR